jgi:hypothetical protein
MNIIPFRSRAGLTADQNLEAFVEHYRPLAKELPQVDKFEDDNWDLRGFCFAPSGGGHKISLSFTQLLPPRRKRGEKALAGPFKDFAKAYLLHRMVQLGATSKMAYQRTLAVLKHVEEVMRRMAPDATPTISALTPAHCQAVQADIRSRVGDDVANDMGNRLTLLVQEIGDFATAKIKPLGLLTKNFRWKSAIIRLTSQNRSMALGAQEQRDRRLPSVEALGATAHLFYTCTHPMHTYVSSIAAILCAQPSRIGEMLRLPQDCELEEERQGRQMYGLRWWPEKSKGKPTVKWFVADSDPWVAPIREAIARLRVLSAPARAMARWYEEHPGKLHLSPGLEYLRTETVLTLEEVAAVRQVQPGWEQTRWCRANGLIVVHDENSGKEGVSFVDFERVILEQLPFGFPFYDLNKKLRYSECICLLRKNEFHRENVASFTMIYMPFLGYFHKHLNEAFAEAGLVECNGDPIRIRSHGFRRRGETAARKAGIAIAWTNARAGRVKTSQSETYDRRTHEEKGVEPVRRLIKEDGRLFGELAIAAPKEPKTALEIEAMLDQSGRLKAVVVTQYGVCTNDFVLSPCTMFMQCLNCKQHVCIKGLPGKTDAINRSLALAEQSLTEARIAETSGDYGVAEHIRLTLEPNVMLLRELVAVMEDPAFPEGTQVMVAQDGRNDPIAKAIQIRVALDQTNGIDTKALETALGSLVTPATSNRFITVTHESA